MSSEFLSIEGVSKSFGGGNDSRGDAVEVLRGIDLQVEQGEVLALLGPSGSGKSTLLRILAGFETADLGRLVLEGNEFTNRTAQQRGFGMVFQSYALFPHLSVADNIGFGLNHLNAEERPRQVASMLELVQMTGLGDRGIDQISGGQQQRVALARALAPEPSLLLLDEPLSNLDPSLRDQTRRQLREVLRAAGATTILVTHEQEEAFELGDRVAVLDQGKIEQVGAPEELYKRPRTSFVATFVGRSNLLPCTAEKVEKPGQASGDDGWRDSWSVALSGTDRRVEMPPSSVIERGGSPDSGSESSTDARLWVRPEHLTLSLHTENQSAPSSVEACDYVGTVRACRLVGPYALIEVSVHQEETVDEEKTVQAELVVEVAHHQSIAVGQRVVVELSSPAAARLLISPNQA